MSFVKIVVFVVIEKEDEETVSEAFHQVLDGFVIRRLPIFDSGLTSTDVRDVENAEEILQEVLESDEDD